MSHVMCHVSHVTFYVSHVKCHVSHVMCYMSIIIFFLQSDEAYWWRVCYQRGLPRLVVMESSFDEQKKEEEIGNKTIKSFIISILSLASIYIRR